MARIVRIRLLGTVLLSLRGDFQGHGDHSTPSTLCYTRSAKLDVIESLGPPAFGLSIRNSSRERDHETA